MINKNIFPLLCQETRLWYIFLAYRLFLDSLVIGTISMAKISINTHSLKYVLINKLIGFRIYMQHTTQKTDLHIILWNKYFEALSNIRMYLVLDTWVSKDNIWLLVQKYNAVKCATTHCRLKCWQLELTHISINVTGRQLAVLNFKYVLCNIS